MKFHLAAVPALALLAAPAFSQSGAFSGHAVLTVLPAHPDEQGASLTASELEAKADGKPVTITGLTQLNSTNSPLELVLLIDGSARNSLWSQAESMMDFVKEMPSNSQMAVAMMQNGRAVLEGPLTSDPATVEKALHMTGGGPGSNASPYFCLSDLAKHWPSQTPGARRAVVMITDGIDEYDGGMDDPYVNAAIDVALRADIVVSTIQWHDQGTGSSGGGMNGLNHLTQLAQATGGNSYWQGSGNPVSLQPYFEDLRKRLRNEFDLSISGPFKGKPFVATFKLKANAPDAKVTAPQSVFLKPVGAQ